MIRSQNGILSLGKFRPGVHSLVPDFNIFILSGTFFQSLKPLFFFAAGSSLCLCKALCQASYTGVIPAVRILVNRSGWSMPYRFK